MLLPPFLRREPFIHEMHFRIRISHDAVGFPDYNENSESNMSESDNNSFTILIRWVNYRVYLINDRFDDDDDHLCDVLFATR
jgi:hypothetical protein